MSSLLLEIVGSATLNATIFPPYLYIYDDLLIFRRRNWFIVREITISYHQLSRVTLTKGIFFSSLDLYTGEDDIKINWISNKAAVSAKDIIDKKIFHSHAKHNPAPENSQDKITNFERSLDRLTELLNKEIISKKEFDKKKLEIMKSFSQKS